MRLDDAIITPHVSEIDKEFFIKMGITAVKLVFQILKREEEKIPVDSFINRKALEKK